MSILLTSTLLAATASIIATGCVAYVLISFGRSGHLLAARVRRQELSLVLAVAGNPRRHQMSRTRAVPLPRLQPIRAS